jgi:hypothetical protein
MKIIETLIIPLVLAAVSGLTFLAYKHPRGYKCIALPIMVSGIMATSMMLAWNGGRLWSCIGGIADKLVEKPDQSLNNIQFMIHDMIECRNLLAKIVIVFVPSIAYLLFLWHLQSLLGVKKDKKNKTSNATTHEEG